MVLLWVQFTKRVPPKRLDPVDHVLRLWRVRWTRFFDERYLTFSSTGLRSSKIHVVAVTRLVFKFVCKAWAILLDCVLDRRGRLESEVEKRCLIDIRVSRGRNAVEIFASK